MDREFKYQTAFRRKHNYLYELGVDKNILDKTQKTHNQKGKKKELHKKKKTQKPLLAPQITSKKIYRQSSLEKNASNTSDKELTSL